jgi:hypothetical protein
MGLMSGIPGILLLYHRPLLRKDAATVTESIQAFREHSAFRVWNVNTECGFPPALDQIRFGVIVLHYSLFGRWPCCLGQNFYRYLERCNASYKVAFFQDEFRYCRKRFDFLNRFRVDCVYTLVDSEYFQYTYQKYTQVPKLVHCIPGYVSDGLIEAARRFAKPDSARTIDIGYRARPLEYYMGTGAQEKHGIAVEFLRRAAGLNLMLDVAYAERSRIYGDDWYRFTGNCRGFLGVEAGVSVFDTEDVVREEVDRLLSARPDIGFQEMHDRVLHKWEDRIPYRTISPRHFEAAAFRVCQILFEGKYSGILQSMVHYIPLKKDWSNFDEVMRLFSDPRVRQTLTENAYRDLIASGRYSYARFIQSFDAELREAGQAPAAVRDERRITALLDSGTLPGKTWAILRALWAYLPGAVRRPLKAIARPWLDRIPGYQAGRD